MVTIKYMVSQNGIQVGPETLFP